MGEAELRDRDRVGEAELERQGQSGRGRVGETGTVWGEGRDRLGDADWEMHRKAA